MSNFLNSKFSDVLDDEVSCRVENGFVHFRSRYWKPSEAFELICKGAASDLLRNEVFTEWIEEYQEEKCSIANEWLESNALSDLFSLLENEYKKGLCIPFVGAGFSAPSKYPQWGEFLEAQIPKAGIDKPSFDEMIKRGEYEEVAQIISERLGVAAFSAALKGAFDLPREIDGLVQMLPLIFKASVITTNFDTVIERVYEYEGNKFEDIFFGAKLADLRLKMNENKRFLLKLHGGVKESTGRILTKNEYDSHYSAQNSIGKIIACLCDRRSLLFLGASLNCDRTLLALKAFVAGENAEELPMHFAFLPKPDKSDSLIERERFLAQHHIYPIWYPRDQRDAFIEAFLVKLWVSAL